MPSDALQPHKQYSVYRMTSEIRLLWRTVLGNSECLRAQRAFNVVQLKGVSFNIHDGCNSSVSHTHLVPLAQEMANRKEVFCSTYLICVVKAVIHESCDQRRLSNCKKKGGQNVLDEI